MGDLLETESMIVVTDCRHLENVAHHDLLKILATIHHAILTSQERDGHLVRDHSRQDRPFLTLFHLHLLPSEAGSRGDVAEGTLSFGADVVVGGHSMTVIVIFYGVIGPRHHRDGAEIYRGTAVSPRGGMTGVSSVEKTIAGRSGLSAKGRSTV